MSQTKTQLVEGLNINTSAPADALAVDNSGRVGIGTTSPGGLLEVRGGEIRVGDAGASSTSVGRLSYGGGTGELDINAYSTGGNTFIKFFTSFGGTNAERARIDNAGRLLVGRATARENLYNNSSGVAPQFQVEGTSYVTSSMLLVRNSNDGNDNSIVFGKTRGTSIGANTVVSSGDGLGGISFQGADGSDLVEAASIQALVDGTPGANDMPGRLVFSTTADGASSPTERMKIKQDGRFIYNTNAQVFHVAGNAYTNGTVSHNVEVVSDASLGSVHFVEAHFTHFANTYAASRTAAIYTRGTSIDHTENLINISTANAGAWTFTKIGNDTLQISKSAGSYAGGFGYYWIRVTSHAQ